MPHKFPCKGYPWMFLQLKKIGPLEKKPQVYFNKCFFYSLRTLIKLSPWVMNIKNLSKAIISKVIYDFLFLFIMYVLEFASLSD